MSAPECVPAYADRLIIEQHGTASHLIFYFSQNESVGSDRRISAAQASKRSISAHQRASASAGCFHDRRAVDTPTAGNA